jgi:hypothetical protein
VSLHLPPRSSTLFPHTLSSLRYCSLESQHNRTPRSPDSIPYFCVDIGSQVTHLPYERGEAPRYEEEVIHPELGVRRIPREQPDEQYRQQHREQPREQPREQQENPFIERSE